jgi:hypothetical protein
MQMVKSGNDVLIFVVLQELAWETNIFCGLLTMVELWLASTSGAAARTQIDPHVIVAGVDNVN